MRVQIQQREHAVSSPRRAETMGETKSKDGLAHSLAVSESRFEGKRAASYIIRLYRLSS